MLMMYKAKGTISAESHTKHIRRNAISMQNFGMLNLVVTASVV
jgi:hypothetical protein